MTKLKINKILRLFALITVLCFLAGCVTKASTTTTHSESGGLSVIKNEIYNDCLENKDYDGAQEVLDTHIKLVAFCCEPYTEVKYDDVKNKNYENINLDIGKLLIAVAAYNEYNEESAVDIEVDWICHYNSCTQEQLDAIDAYIEWYHNAQNGHYTGTIREYNDMVNSAYQSIIRIYDITNAPAYNNLTPAQFQEVQNYMADPDYQVDKSLWE